MNNELKINMKLISSDNINMKLEDSKPINANMNGGIVETDPIFTDSPAYTITYNDIKFWNNKSNFSGNYNDLSNKPIIPSRTSQLFNDSGYITKDVTNLANYTLSNNLSAVATTGLYSDLLEKPTIPTKTSDLENDNGFVTSDTSDLENYTLTSNLATVATTGSYSDLLNTPTLANVATSGQYSDLLNKPTLSTVASTGDYDDLIDKPDLSNYVTKDVNDLTYYTLTSNLATVATSGSYADLSNTPTIPTAQTLNVYSDTETIIGTWLGKPLYRKVSTTTSITLGSQIQLESIANVKECVKLSGVLIGSSGFTIPIGVLWDPSNISTRNTILWMDVGSTSGTLKYQIGTAWTSAVKLIAIVEYTKTTD